MLSKNNRKLQERKLQEKQRFGFRKYSFGLASALIGVSFMLGTGNTVSADTTTTPAENVETATKNNANPGTGTEDTSSSKVAGAAAVSTTDTPATETKAGTTATTPADNSTAETKTVAVDPEANNTAPDGSETDKTTSDDNKTKTTDDSAEKLIDSVSSSQNNTSIANAQTESVQTDKQDSAAPADTQNVAAAQTETAEAASVPSNQLAQSKATVRKNAIMLAASTTTVTDDATKAEGKITDEGKAKGLTDSNVGPEMSDANGASLKLDDSKIPSGYEADPKKGRYTFAIVSLGGDFVADNTGSQKNDTYNDTHGTKYYLRFSTSSTDANGKDAEQPLAQVVDGNNQQVIWESLLKPEGTVEVDKLSNVGSDGKTYNYLLTYNVTTIKGVSTRTIDINTNRGTQSAKVVYSADGSNGSTPASVVHLNYPNASTIKTEYIAKDAAGNKTILAEYDETGRQGYTYTISGKRTFKGYDLISSPSETETKGTLSSFYNVGDIIFSTQKQLSDTLQIARVNVVTSTDGTAQVVLKVAKLGASLADIADESVWKTILSTEPVAPGGGYSTKGNYDAGSAHPNGAFLLYTLKQDGSKPIGVRYLTDAGFTEDQLKGYEKYLTAFGLYNRLTPGQEPANYYYAPQGQVKINYVTSDGTVIQAPVSAYENSGANTSYDVTGSTYHPQTITVNGKTYRSVEESYKPKETAGTTEVNGYTYTVTQSEPTGTIKSATVNDVYYVYKLVTYHTEPKSKDVTRTIEYYDSVTGEAIPADLEKTVTQTATLNRSEIYDDQNNFIGYGTVSADGSSYTIDDSWKVADQTWTKQDSADLTGYGYTAPDRASVDAVTVDGNTPDNVTEKVYYGHQTVPVTPENPGTPGKPINPKGNVDYPDGVSKDDLTSTVKRTINYVDEDGNAVNGSPDGTSSYVQKAEFTRTAIVDKVTGKILGYDTDNDGKVDTESKDRAWTPTEKTLEAVKSADPSSVGYDKVDKSTVESLLVTPGQADTTVTVTYSKTTYSLKDEESKTVTRTINYVDSVTGEAIPAELEPSVTQKATLTRSVIYDNKGNKIGYGTVSADGSSYTLDDSWKVADQTWTKQDSADLSDYGYTAPDKATVEAETVDGSTTDTTVTVYYGHQTVPVTPENPGTPGKPINPKGNVDYPDGVSKDDLTSAVTRTINYVDEDGKAVNGSPDGTSSYVQKAEFTRTAIVDKVTGKILGYDTDNDGKVDTESKDRAWTPTEKTLEAVKSADPSSVGYDKVDKSTVESLLVTPGQADTTVTVTYSNKQVSGTIKYIDVTTGVELDSDTLPTGKVGSKINYKTKDKIKSYENQGYELVSNDFTDGSQVYEKEGNNFVVKLNHKTQTITPNDPNPVTPGEPINPNDPNSPVYGEETDRKNLVKDASQTIHYVGAGDKTPADNVVTQKDAFTRTVTIDKVTGKVLSYTDWTGEKTFNTVGTPVVEGYHADKKVAGGLTATVDNPDVEETVTYAPNGKLVPVDPKGTPIPGADTPTYPTDPNDPTKVVPNEPIPDVPNYTPVDPSPVTPKDPGKDTPVPYTKNETPAAKYGLTEKFVDEDGNELLPSEGKGTDYKTGDSYDVTKDAKVITGYVLVKTTDTAGTFEKSDKTAVFTYKKLGKIVPVDPKGTPIPGADTPTYKNDPDDPSKVVPNEPTPKVPGYKTDVPKVTPEDPTKDTPVPYTKDETPSAKYGLTEKFVDEDGNELLPSVNKGTDYKTGDKYDVTKDAKVITGYVLVKTTDTTGTFEKSDKTAVFTYKKLGKIVPVDPKGTPIPGADTPTYKNDPDDPSKVVPNEPTPKVPGYKTDVPKVTPEDPTKDTPVPYTKDETPAAKYGLTEKFVDVDGNELSPSVSKGTDYKTGDKYDVTKDAKVITGYVLVKTTDTTGTFEKSDKTAVFTYKKLGKIVPVDPKGTPIPGADTPTYKNDPDDPSKVVPNEPTPKVPGYKTDVPKVTPEDPTKDTPVPYTKDETPAAKYGLTEKFVDEDGNELSPSVNKGTDYKNGDKYDVTKDAKVITGYVLVKTTNTAGTFEKSDKTAVFTYKKLGKIVPVDPKGNPIPGADTPTYKNDPDDPSKAVPNEPTPKVPGYKTDVPKVTPEDPTKDTPVPYTKNETPAAKYGLTEKFVDEDGNELSPSVNKGTDYKTGDKYDVTKDAKVITGYVLVKATDTTGTFTDGNKTAVFTYKKLGKIVPVDPKGNPIPGADTPTYKNDPDDPSKVVPNEPTPKVPGYKTDVPNVTPEDPTKDTPVPYTKNETPAAKYGLTEKFVDENGNELSPSVSKGTDYKNGDKYDVTKDAKVITGYVLVKTTDTTGTFTDGNKTAVFTYKKIGKLVPVDPKGNPIPGADTPSYKNDPTDPSEVVPNEPTPEVPGWTTNVPNVTPEDPTKDTLVPYTKGEKGKIPSTPESPTGPEGSKTASQPNNPGASKQTTFTPASDKKLPSAASKSNAQLPQTGADERKAGLLSALGLGVIALTALVGLLGEKKRKY